MRITKVSRLTLSALLFMALAPSARAVSEHFPNDGNGGGNIDNPCTGCGGTALNLTLVAPPGQANASVGLAAGETGQTVALDSVTNLCQALDALPGWSCTPACTFPPSLVICTNTDGRELDFSYPSPNPFSFTIVEGNSNTKITHLHARTSAGNTHGPDLLNRVLVRVKTNGNDGNVLFGVTGAPGPGPNPFTVDTTGKTDSEIVDAMCHGYAAIGVTPVEHTSADAAMSAVPASMDGSFVELRYPASVSQFEVNGQPGQTLVTETVQLTFTSASVPALSEWGMIVLIALLALTGIWMIRKRQRVQST